MPYSCLSSSRIVPAHFVSIRMTPIHVVQVLIKCHILVRHHLVSFRYRIISFMPRSTVAGSTRIVSYSFVSTRLISVRMTSNHIVYNSYSTVVVSSRFVSSNFVSIRLFSSLKASNHIAHVLKRLPSSRLASFRLVSFRLVKHRQADLIHKAPKAHTHTHYHARDSEIPCMHI